MHFMLAAPTPAGVVSLPEGAAMAVIRAPLRASGETLGPVFRTGRRRRPDVVLLLEGVVLICSRRPRCWIWRRLVVWLLVR